MSVSEDLINFEIIENQKENIQSLPGGRSARMLANLFSPSPLHALSTPTPSDTKNLNDAIRQEYEVELVNISESDDPLDIYDRYVRWTMDAYPSAQATPSSQLLPLLERATKTFLNSTQYKNDPRYLKLWLSYIRFFSDTPRETFAFLARHNIGEGLALFYEEFATWLEGADRWVQAEEVYRLGIDREARPTPRLLRKFDEFHGRFAQRPQDSNEPSSPALPAVRPALAAKIDPFAAAPRDPQAPRPSSGVGGSSTTKSGRQKLAIFSDGDEAPPAVSTESTKGWESIGALADRKKENTMEPKPWVGETLKAGGKKSSTKLTVFKDESSQIPFPQIPIPELQRVTINPRNGRSEYVFVDLEALYPAPGTNGPELCFEELMAGHRGWLEKAWKPETSQVTNVSPQPRDVDIDIENVSRELLEKLTIPRDPVVLDENGVAKEHSREGKGRRMKIKEVNETQIIKAKLSSPSGPKMTKRKSSKEQTMTLHTRAATDEIYDLFNQPLKSVDDDEEEEESDDDDGDMTDGEYTSGGESTTTGRLVTTSEAGDDETSDVKSVSEWSEFTARKHVPAISDAEEDEDNTEASKFSSVEVEVEVDSEKLHLTTIEVNNESSPTLEEPELVTPVSPNLPSASRTLYIPMPSEEYVAPTQPYKNPFQVSRDRLPFMTPIMEKTETNGLPTVRADTDYFDSKTPTKVNGGKKRGRSSDDNDASSPFRDSPFKDSPNKEVVANSILAEISQPLLEKTSSLNKTAAIVAKVQANGGALAKEVALQGPIIQADLCFATDQHDRDLILASLNPPLKSYSGYFEHTDKNMERRTKIEKFAKALPKSKGNLGDKTTTNITMLPQLFFQDSTSYYVHRGLGSGSFGDVYLVESLERDDSKITAEVSQSTIAQGTFDCFERKKFEAIKIEADPASAWEFYIVSLARRRLGLSRPTESLIQVYEMHLYKDESYLVQQYCNQGTVLDAVNVQKAASSSTEAVAMFFAVELFRTIEALHAKDIIHGDIKVDNCLVRLETIPDSKWDSRYHRDGTSGWNKKGITLIDFGRSIDKRAYTPKVKFMANWNGDECCPEIRETRPWTYQIDYHGIADIIHHLLYDKPLDTIGDKNDDIGAGAGKKWRLKESFKRYWQQQLWSQIFDLLLNPNTHVAGEEGAKFPLLKGMKALRDEMELWLEEQRGNNLQMSLKKLEYALTPKRRGA